MSFKTSDFFHTAQLSLVLKDIVIVLLLDLHAALMQ